MKKLFKQHYQAIVDRGLINSETGIYDFFDKIVEEMQELANAIFEDSENKNQELIDLMMVCVNLAEWIGIDIEKELIENIKIQEKRVNENKNK